MTYPRLRRVGPNADARELALEEGELVVGSEVDGPGRLVGRGVEAVHAQFEWEDGQLVHVKALGGEVLVNDVAVARSAVKPGATVAIGEYELELEMIEGLHPAIQAELTGLEQAAQGGRPYRYAVTFEADGVEEGGILEAGGGRLGLVGVESGTAFEVPIAELTGVAYPRHRSAVIDLTAGGRGYRIRLQEVVWIPDGFGGPEEPTGGLEDNVPITLLATNPAAFSTLTDAATAVGMALSAAGAIADRAARRRWKRILEGEDIPEDVAKADAQERLPATPP